MGGKMCPFLCYFSNGWTWKFKNYQKMICLPPSLNNSTPNQTYLTTELWNGFFRKNYKSWLSASKPHFRILSHLSEKSVFFQEIVEVAPFFDSKLGEKHDPTIFRIQKIKQNKIEILPPKMCPLFGVSCERLDLEI